MKTSLPLCLTACAKLARHLTLPLALLAMYPPHAAQAADGALPAAGRTLIQNVRVFDGEKMQDTRSVLIDGNKITDANFHGKVPATITVVDGKGRTLLPGLIDSHVHAWRFLDLPLLFGVTTQVDMFTGVQLMQEITRKMQQGENQEQADLFSAGTLATCPEGHGTEYGMAIPTLSTPQQAQAFVDARIAEGSYFIKIVMEEGSAAHPVKSLDMATAKALIDAAHKRGKMAVVHISKPALASAMLEAGADGLVHMFNGETISDADTAAFVRLAKAKQAFIIPTFSVLESIAGMHPEDILNDPASSGLLTREQRQTLATAYRPQAAPALMNATNKVTKALAAAGVPLLAGTDAGNTGTQYGISMQHELLAMTKAGLSPDQALAAATSVPARTFHLGQRGRIANGYKADLLLVDGNPGMDINAIRQIVEVWKDGMPVSARRLAQQQKVQQESAAAQANPALPLPPEGRISLFGKDKLASPFGLGWMASTDAQLGGKSVSHLTLLDDTINGQPVLKVETGIRAGFPWPFAGLALLAGSDMMHGVNLSNARVLRFRVQGDGKRYKVSMLSPGMSIPAALEFGTTAQWQEITLKLADFTGVDSRNLSMVSFGAGPELGEYRFNISDIRLLAE